MQDLVVGGEAPGQVLGGIPPSTWLGLRSISLIVLSLIVVSWPGNCTKTYNDTGRGYGQPQPWGIGGHPIVFTPYFYMRGSVEVDRLSLATHGNTMRSGNNSNKNITGEAVGKPPSDTGKSNNESSKRPNPKRTTGEVADTCVRPSSASGIQATTSSEGREPTSYL